MGLRATGSIDYTTDSLFVPEAYSYHATNRDPAARRHASHLGIINLGLVCHTAWASASAGGCWTSS